MAEENLDDANLGEALWLIESRLDPDGRNWSELSGREREHYQIMAKEFFRFLRSRLIAGDNVITRHPEKGE